MNDLELAIQAAHEAGDFLRRQFRGKMMIDESTHHDLKLALDRRSQDLIAGILLSARPNDALYGEEGVAGEKAAGRQWIVDPIDGTVNYYQGIAHFCVSIGLRIRDEMIAGVVHDPMTGETWTVEKGAPAFCNGKRIETSRQTTLDECVLLAGCGKDEESVRIGMERFQRVALRARKMRMMGSAALGLCYVASGRLDAYIESRVSLWDIAAGKLLVESAGGTVDLQPVNGHPDSWSIIATNGKIPIEELQ